MILALLVLVFLFALLIPGLRVVPQQQVWVVQRLGRFSRTLEPGLNWIISGIDQVLTAIP